MGIKGLLPKLASITHEITANDLRQQTIGVDASTWIYAVLYRNSLDILLGKADSKCYVREFMKGIDVLREKDIKPVVVFDGCALPAKMQTTDERRRKKTEAKHKALMCVEQGDMFGAKLQADRAMSVTDEIVDQFLQALDEHDVSWIRAPFEADAQLTYMANAGVVRYIITEDADLLVYGAPRVIYKWNRYSGSGQCIEHADLYKCVNFKMSLKRFQIFCILSGCDYIHSLHGIGLNLAEKFVTQVGECDLFAEIPQIWSIVGRKRALPVVPTNYVEEVRKALFVFRHQAVYDVGLKKVVPYTPLDAGEHHPSHLNAAGLASAKPPIYSRNITRVWISEEDLDVSYGSDDDSYTLLQLSALSLNTKEVVTVEIATAGVLKVWVPPCLTVLQLNLWLGQAMGERPVAIHMWNRNHLPGSVPFTISSRDYCNIVVDDVTRLLLWKWDINSDDDVDNEVEEVNVEGDKDEDEDQEDEDEDEDQEDEDEESEDEDQDNDDGLDTESEPEGDDVVVLDGDEDDDVGEQWVDFKVLGVTYGMRQNYIACAKDMIANGEEVPAVLFIEEDNPVDPGGIAVTFDTGAAHFGEKIVGYLPKEFKEDVTQFLKEFKITKVEIQHIKMRVNFNPIGLYILLRVTKQGRWPNYIIRKSLRAR